MLLDAKPGIILLTRIIWLFNVVAKAPLVTKKGAHMCVLSSVELISVSSQHKCRENQMNDKLLLWSNRGAVICNLIFLTVLNA